MSEQLLAIRDLVVQFETDDGLVHAVNGLSLDLFRGETLGLVGETGAGKTTTALSVMKLVDEPAGKYKEGEILFDGEDLMGSSKARMQKIRGKRISMIFQDPMSTLNPVLTIGDQVAEVVRLHDKNSQAEAVQRAMEILELVGIPPERYDDYPHQFSGGMKQRIVIAIAIACSPELLIADEPTTALDVTIQAQILHLLQELKQEKRTSILMITHDLGIIAQMCDRVAVMYAGEVIESGTVEHIFNHTRHPYTIGLFDSLPNLYADTDRLKPITGMVPDPFRLPEGCKFHSRCPYAQEQCSRAGAVPLLEVAPGHGVRCLRTDFVQEVEH